MGKLVRGWAPLLDPAEAEAEKAFGALCSDYAPDVVGVWGDRPIHYPPLVKLPVPLIGEQLVRELRWDQFLPAADIQRQLQEAAQAEAAIIHQQVAFAGWLTGNEDYQREKVDLNRRWVTLDALPALPFFANTHDQQPIAVGAVDAAQALPPEVAGFLDDVGRFLRKWQVAQLITWDLPLPQGPLAGIPVGAARHLLGPDQVVSALPAYFDLPSQINTREEIRDMQRAAASALGHQAEHPLTDLSPRGENVSTLEAAFRMWLLERAARLRYGDRLGLVARLDTAFANIFRFSRYRVRQVRRRYSAFLSADPALIR
jgi:hypothetical protein